MNRAKIPGLNRVSRSVLALAGALAVAPAHAAWTLNMTRGDTDLTSEVFDLHMLVFWVCVVIGIGVFGVMLYSVIAHRKSRGVEAAHFHESTGVEIAWTVVPFIILIALAIPAAGTLLKVEDSSNPDMTIRVTGHQWLWEYDYVDQNVHFYSRLDKASDRARQPGSRLKPQDVPHYLRNVDKPMVVPVHKKVRLLLTSGDVIHAWWVPQLGGKKDAIPGYINDMWFKANKTGTYRGQCAELCGRGHAFMPIVVRVVSQSDYDKWVAGQGGNTNDNSALAKGQPSTDNANAQAQTSGETSPTAGNATKGRTENDSSLNPEAAKNSLVGVGKKDNQGKSESQETDAAQASPDRGSPKVNSPETNATGDQPSAKGQGKKDNSDSDNKGNSGKSDSSSSQNSSSQSGAGNAASSSGKDTAAAGGMSKADLMAAGKKVYGNICVACHQPDGKGLPAAGFPALAGSTVATGPIAAHIKQILHGKNAMPPYAGTLDDKQIAGVATYERNAFGNHTGDVVQPSDVAKQR